jgi:hypothetical protein
METTQQQNTRVDRFTEVKTAKLRLAVGEHSGGGTFTVADLSSDAGGVWVTIVDGESDGIRRFYPMHRIHSIDVESSHFDDVDHDEIPF